MQKRGSLWLQTGTAPRFEVLSGDVHVDVAVVGGGITGLTCALLLQRAGKRVAIIERDRVGSGVSGGTTAHLATMPDWGYETVQKKFGLDGARTTAKGMQRAVTLIERLIDDFDFECTFARVPGYYYAGRPEDEAEVESEIQAAQRAGLEIERVREVPLPFRPTVAGKIPGQGRFHILEYLAGLASAARARGIQIYESTPVVELDVADPCRLTTARGPVVVAHDVVLATHSPLGFSLIQTEIAPYRSYALAARIDGPIEDALYWDSCSPYHYTRLHGSAGERLVIIGGEDHKTGHASEGEAAQRLEQYARERFQVLDIPFAWSAQIFDPADGLPFIGEDPGRKHVFIATGFSGDGMTFGTLSAEILCNLILGREDPFAKLFSPSRLKPLAKAAHFVKENLDVAKRFVLDRLSVPDRTEIDKLSPGQGCVVAHDGQKVAAYRDDGGRLVLMSAVCPHLKCIVRFNPLERSWDCPCHGSRFGSNGEVLEGPTLQGLKALTPE